MRRSDGANHLAENDDEWPYCIIPEIGIDFGNYAVIQSATASFARLKDARRCSGNLKIIGRNRFFDRIRNDHRSSA
jgi:hypothetical protein